jgi:hypothetical protein
MSIVHESNNQVNGEPAMRGLCVKNFNGKLVLSRPKYREVETGLAERALSDARTNNLLVSPRFPDVEEGFSILATFAVEAVDDQLKSDLGIDSDEVDEVQVKRLVYAYTAAFARQSMEVA